MNKVINIIIVEDSKTSTMALQTIIEAEPDMKVIACAKDGAEAVELTRKLKPDLVTMDIFMPKLDGVEATSAIMDQCPTPILVISSPSNDRESKYVFDALQAGALSIIEKPAGHLNGDFTKVRRHIVTSIRALASVHVFHRRPKKTLKLQNISENQLGAKILVLGTSTGGPEALRCIISALPANFPMPIVITQHITKGFLPGLVHWLQSNSKLQIQIATDRQKLLPGFIYFAADNLHLKIIKGVTPIAILDDSPEVDHFKPSINVLFSSVASSYPGAAIGGLLTGMGKDGAEGLLNMKKAGCLTFAQSEKTCTIYGMPNIAVAMNAAQHTVDLEKIPQFLAKLVAEGRS